MRKTLSRAATLNAEAVISTRATASMEKGGVRHIHFDGSRFRVLDGSSDLARRNGEGAGRRDEIEAGTERCPTQMSLPLTDDSPQQNIVCSGINACPIEIETVASVTFLR